MHTPIVLMVVGIPGNVNNIVILVKDYISAFGIGLATHQKLFIFLR